MSAHAKYSPSSAYRWTRCPHSAVLGATVPNRDSDEADEGTRVHALLEHALKTGQLPPESDDGYHGVAITVDFARKLGAGNLMAEQRVGYVDLPLVWGTGDLFHDPLPALAEGGLYIYTIGDYKNGAYDVEALGNEQMLTYAGAVLTDMRARRANRIPDWWRLAIFQPNSASNGDAEPVKQWLASTGDIDRHIARLHDAVRRGEAGEGPQPGPHCRWCSAFGHCAATRDTLPLLLESVRMLPNAIPDQALVAILRVLRGLGDFKKLLDAELLARLTTGRKIDGALLGQTNSHRTWKDDLLAAKTLYAAYGTLGVKAVTPAQAEKLGPVGSDLVKRIAKKPPGTPVPKY